MRTVILLLITMLATTPALAADEGRTAVIVDKEGAVWNVSDLYVWGVPGPYYESRFSLAVATDTFQVAVPPENLISIQPHEKGFLVRYRWMGREHTLVGKLLSEQVGGKMSAGYVHVRIDTLKELSFTEGPEGTKEQTLPPLRYDTILVLTDGSRVPAANLLRVSAQAYAAAPASGVDAGTVYTPHNDVGFFKAQTAPTIEFEDIQSMEFPTENSILLTLRQGATQVKEDTNQKAFEDFDLLKGNLDDLNLTQMDPNAGRLAPKNLAYGFSGIFERGFFFIAAEHVKAVEFVSEKE